MLVECKTKFSFWQLIVIETKLASNFGFGSGFSEWDSGYPYRIDRNEADVDTLIGLIGVRLM